MASQYSTAPVPTSSGDATIQSQYSDPVLRKLLGGQPMAPQANMQAPATIQANIDPKKVPIKLPETVTAAPQASSTEDQAILNAATTTLPPQVTNSTASATIDPKSKAALAASGAREQATLASQEEYLKAQSEATRAAQAEADSIMGTSEENARRLQEEVNTLNEQAKKDLQDIDAGIQKAKDFQYQNFWADKGTDFKIQSAIAIGLGALGASLLGSQQNVGYEMLKKAMEDDARLQDTKYNQIIQGIEGSKLALAQKQSMIDRATKNYEVYKAARFDAVKDSINKKIASNPKFAATPELQAVMTQLEMEKEKAMQGIIDKTSTKLQTQQETKAAQSQTLTPEQWIKISKPGAETTLGQYNEAVDRQNMVQNFKQSGLGKGAIVMLVAKILEQGSYDPDKFDLRSQDQARKWIDAATGKLKGVNETEYFKSVERLMENHLALKYNQAKGSIPAAMMAGQRIMGDQGAFVRKLPKNFNPNKKDLSELGLKKAD